MLTAGAHMAKVALTHVGGHAAPVHAALPTLRQAGTCGLVTCITHATLTSEHKQLNCSCNKPFLARQTHSVTDTNSNFVLCTPDIGTVGSYACKLCFFNTKSKNLNFSPILQHTVKASVEWGFEPRPSNIVSDSEDNLPIWRRGWGWGFDHGLSDPNAKI